MAYKTKEEMFGDNVLIPTPGAFGPQVPISLSPPPGTYSGNRGIQFGEQLTAAIANRTHYALALNTDDLNSRIASFEVGGLDAAYNNGTVGPAGGGRQITKNAGAVETVSALATQYADDPANAHFRADALADTTASGGFDFRGAVDPAYGMLSRQNVSPSVAYTTMSTVESVFLNPAAIGGDVVRFPANVHDGTNTDVAFDAQDFVEITGSATSDGLYRLYNLGPATTDFLVRRLDGTAPSFPVNETGSARFFIAHAMSSATKDNASRKAALALSSTQLESTTILSLVGRDIDGLLGTGPESALSFSYRRPDGFVESRTRFTTTGRLKSVFNLDAIPSSIGLEIQRKEGSLASVVLNKEEGAPFGVHEVGVLVTDEGGFASAFSGLETRSPIRDASLGVTGSIDGTFAAPVGRVILHTSDGTPPPPAGLAHGAWADTVQPGFTLVQIASPGPHFLEYFLLSSVNIDPVVTNPDEMTLVRPDGSALGVGELPTAGTFQFRFIARSTFGGRSAPVAVDSVPAGYAVPPAGIVANTALFPSKLDYVPGQQSVVAVAGDLVGTRSRTVLATGPLTLDVPWALTRDGYLYTKGNIRSSSPFGQYTRQTPLDFTADSGSQTGVLNSSGVTVTFASNQNTVAASSSTISDGLGNTGYSSATSMSVGNGLTTSTVTAGNVSSSDFVYPAPLPIRTAYVSASKFNGSTITTNLSDPEIEWLYFGAIISQVDNATAWLDLSGILRSGCVVTSIEFSVSPGASRSSGNRFRFSFDQSTLAGGSTGLGNGDDGGSAVLNWYPLTPGSPVSLDFENYAYTITVFAGDDSPNPHNTDVFYGIRINYTDPGPRNH
jgi:hypothetical protein